MEFPIWPSDSRIARFPVLDRTILPPEQDTGRSQGFGSSFLPSDEPRLLSRFTPDHKRRERWTDEVASDAVLLGGETLVLHALTRRKATSQLTVFKSKELLPTGDKLFSNAPQRRFPNCRRHEPRKRAIVNH